MAARVPPSITVPIFGRALEFLRTRTNYEQIDRSRAALDLAPMHALLERLGHPEHKQKIIHIAGTKGKGSTTWFADALLRRCGARVGRYISPHLHRIEERVAIGGRAVSPQLFGEAVMAVAPHADNINNGTANATFFDVLTAAAFWIYQKENVEFVVMETGLGGRLDSTNATPKVAAVLTSLGLEHTEILGPTMEDIAREKAMIARSGVPLFSVTNENTPEGRVITNIAKGMGAPLYLLDRDFRAQNVRAEGRRLVFDIITNRSSYSGVAIPSPATYQIENATLAAAVVDELEAKGWIRGLAAALQNPPDAAISDFTIPGRFEIVDSEPPVVIDGAHTAESLAALFDAVERVFPGRSRVVVFGASQDKDLPRLLRILSGRADLIVATQSSSMRAAEAGTVATAASAAGIVTKTVRDPAAAIESARAMRDAVVVVTGSLYLVADARAALQLSIE
ncbi:MAG: bifunctional folylpolyglutamate synthase/dihydrofolate synthase [Planctomycetota bacterium]